MDKHQILFEKVFDYARKNDNVRVLVMNGSRVNPNIEPDQYQDFDMVYYVSDLSKQIEDHKWVQIFGKALVKQYKDDQRDANPDEPYYNYMMQYMDGTRLDLTIMRIEDCHESIHSDSLTKVLLDKDAICPDLKASESSYFIQKPSSKDFYYCVNEFYWLMPYIAKGIARGHLTYALKHLSLVRQELEHMMDYWIGYKKGYNQSVGKGKHRYSAILRPDIYDLYKGTYAEFDSDHISRALFNSLDLFDELAKDISKEYQYQYQKNLKEQMIVFLKDNYKIKETL